MIAERSTKSKLRKMNIVGLLCLRRSETLGASHPACVSVNEQTNLHDPAGKPTEFVGPLFKEPRSNQLELLCLQTTLNCFTWGRGVNYVGLLLVFFTRG